MTNHQDENSLFDVSETDTRSLVRRSTVLRDLLLATYSLLLRPAYNSIRYYDCHLISESSI